MFVPERIDESFTTLLFGQNLRIRRLAGPDMLGQDILCLLEDGSGQNVIAREFHVNMFIEEFFAHDPVGAFIL